MIFKEMLANSIKWLQSEDFQLWFKKNTHLIFLIGLILLLSFAALIVHSIRGNNQSTELSDSSSRAVSEIQELLSKSNSALGQGQYDQAVAILGEALQKYPHQQDLLLQLGMSYRKMKRHGEAEAIYQQLLQKNPDCMECLNNQAVNLLQWGETKKAEDILKQVTGKQANYPEAFLNLAIVFEKTDQIHSAVKAYQEYLKLVPMNDSRPEPAMARERLRHLEEGL